MSFRAQDLIRNQKSTHEPPQLAPASLTLRFSHPPQDAGSYVARW
ncbi:hypothetical protein [Kribbella sp. NPDC006257]